VTDESGTVHAHRSIMAMVAPGTPLRAGLERILAGRTGALIVLGVDRSVEALCDGGFRLELDFSPTRLRELTKMDGAVLLSADAARILGANIQLMPDAGIPTVESGTRHRTAERVAVQTSRPVIAVSHSMNVISLYHDGHRHEVADSSTILARANQALATLHRYRARLDEVAHALSIAEIEDVVTLRDALTVLQRLLMVRRIADELTGNVVELGTDGRLLGLQLDELLAGTEGLRELLVRDYLPADAGADADTGPGVAPIVARLDELSGEELLDLPLMARELGYHAHTDSLDGHVGPRGHRLLARIPRVPPAVLDRLATHFGSLQGVLAATAADLQTVDGVGEARARVIREGLSRLVETSLSDRPPQRW
jgi:diadenylate cyclase